MTSGAQPESPQWLSFLLITLCGLCYTASNFFAWGWPSIDGYPAIERFLDPSFLSEDFYTNTTGGYGVDTPQAVFFGRLEQWTGFSYEWMQASLNLLRCLLFPWLLYHFFNVFTHDRNTALLAVVLGSLANFVLPRTLGWSWLWGDPSPAMYVVFILLPAWTFFLQRKPWATFLLLALTSFIHPLVTVHGCLLIALIYFFDYNKTERVNSLRCTKNWVCGGLFAAAFCFQYFMLSPEASAKLPTVDYLNIVAYIRHPGDFIPSHWHPSAWLNVGLSSIAILAMLIIEWKNIPRRSLLLAALAGYVMVCVLGYVFIELWPLRFLIQLIPFRLVIIGAPLLLLAITIFAANQLRSGRYEILALIILASLCVVPAFEQWIHYAVCPSLLIAAVIYERIICKTDINLFYSEHIKQWFARAMLGGVITVLITISLSMAIHHKENFIVPTIDNQHSIYAWIQENTDTEAIFLVEQHAGNSTYGNAISPQKMRLIGRRAVVASKDFPFLDRDMVLWNDRWQIALNSGQYNFIESASSETLLAIHQQYPFDYLVRHKPLALSIKGEGNGESDGGSEGNNGEHPGFQLVKKFEPSQNLKQLFVYRFTDVSAAAVQS